MSVLSRGRRIGLCVSAEGVAVAGTEGETIVWARAWPANDIDAGTIGAALGEIARRGFRHSPVFACLGPQHAQLRRLGNEGWTRRQIVARQVVEQDARKFFLVNGRPVSISNVDISDAGEAEVAALDRELLAVVDRACSAQGLRLQQVVPACTVAGRGTSDGCISWPDGSVELDATYVGGALTSSRRSPRLAAAGDEDGALRLTRAAAIGAARAGAAAGLAVRMGAERSGRRRVRLSSAVFAVSALAALLMPPALDLRRAAAMEASAAQLMTATSGNRATQRAATLLSGALTQLNTFTLRRRSAMVVLAELTVAIEPPTVLLSIQGDTAGGSLTAITPRAASLVAVLDTLPMLRGVRVVGPVTQEVYASVPGVTGAKASGSAPAMERVTIRFGWSASSSARGARR